MEGAPLNLILDVIILVLLGLTIVYAARLSLQLRRLRDSKSELDKIVKALIRNIDKADHMIQGLKAAVRDSGTDLQDEIDRATAISDELQLMTDSGDRLAARLEGLVDTLKPVTADLPPSDVIVEPKKPRPAPAEEPVQEAEPQAQAEQPRERASYIQHLRKLDASEERDIVRAPSSGGGGNFAIRDMDAERGIDPKDAAKEDESLYSEAERDLLRAMRGNR